MHRICVTPPRNADIIIRNDSLVTFAGSIVISIYSGVVWSIVDREAWGQWAE